MSAREEFLKEISELRSKINSEATPQKNKTLLQYIQEICQKKIEEGNLAASFEKKINKIAAQAKEDLAKIKNVKKDDTLSGEDPNDYSYGRSLRPTQAALSSVKIGLFDASKSPILRRLKQKKPLTAQKKISPQSVTVNEEKQPQPLEMSSSSVEIDSKSSAGNLSSKQEEEIAPFPEPTPFPVAEEEEHEPKLIAAYLQIDQLELRIELPFDSNLIRLGRQDFEKHRLEVDVPANFFDPVIERSSDQEPSEHCVIEQPSLGEFILRDRFNSQKTYFLNHFVDQEGTTIKDGDKFILPVYIKNQLASLSIQFHLK